MNIGDKEKVTDEPKPIKAPIIVPIPRREPAREPVPVYAPGRGPEDWRTTSANSRELVINEIPRRIICPKKSCNNLLKEKDTDHGLELVCPKHGIYQWDEIFKIKAVK